MAVVNLQKGSELMKILWKFFFRGFSILTWVKLIAAA